MFPTDNDFGPAGADALLEALAKNTTVTNLGDLGVLLTAPVQPLPGGILGGPLDPQPQLPNGFELLGDVGTSSRFQKAVPLISAHRLLLCGGVAIPTRTTLIHPSDSYSGLHDIRAGFKFQ